MKQNMLISFLTLRKIVGILGVSLSFLVVVGGLLFGKGKVEGSISAYYGTNMRDVFVAVLAIAGAFLTSYHGYDKLDNVLSKVAGVSAIFIGLFPFAYFEPGNFLNIQYPAIRVLHYVSAAVFFLSIAALSYFQFSKGSNKLRNIVYKTCGIVIFASVVLAGLHGITSFGGNYFILIIEAVMLVAFGVSWFVKGQGILKD